MFFYIKPAKTPISLFLHKKKHICKAKNKNAEKQNKRSFTSEFSLQPPSCRAYLTISDFQSQAFFPFFWEYFFVR